MQDVNLNLHKTPTRIVLLVKIYSCFLNSTWEFMQNIKMSLK